MWMIPPDYTIYQRTIGGVVWYGAKNGMTGVVDFWGISASTVINSAIAALTSGGLVWIKQGTYVINNPILISNNLITLMGQGINSILDGDGLATGEHGIVLSGVVSCTVKELSVQTEDGGGKICHCIFIENGSSNFLIDNVYIGASDSNGIHIEGTDINYGWITHCDISGCDGDGIYVSMDAANYMDYLQIVLNHIYSNGGDGVEFALRVRDGQIKINQINANTGFGVNISSVTSTNNVVENNKFNGNGLGPINDGGAGTILPLIFVEVPNPDSAIGQHRGTQMINGVDTVIGLEFYVPFEFQGLVTAQVVVLQTGDALSGNMVWTVATDAGLICAGNYADDQDTGGATSAITQNQLECLDVSAALTALAAGDLVGLEFTRDGDAVADTLAATAFVLGIRLRYV